MSDDAKPRSVAIDDAMAEMRARLARYLYGAHQPGVILDEHGRPLTGGSAAGLAAWTDDKEGT